MLAQLPSIGKFFQKFLFLHDIFEFLPHYDMQYGFLVVENKVGAFIYKHFEYSMKFFLDSHCQGRRFVYFDINLVYNLNTELITLIKYYATS